MDKTEALNLLIGEPDYKTLIDCLKAIGVFADDVELTRWAHITEYW